MYNLGLWEIQKGVITYLFIRLFESHEAPPGKTIRIGESGDFSVEESNIVLRVFVM